MLKLFKFINIFSQKISIIINHHGPSVHCKDEAGYTPLFNAAKSGSLSNIIELVKNGANVNQIAEPNDKYFKKNTPLFFAKSYDAVKLLLRYGASEIETAIISENGKDKELMPIDYFVESNSVSNAKAILDNSITTQKEDNILVMDLRMFDKRHKGNNVENIRNEMLVFYEAKEKGLNSLLLHPLMQIYLSLKFRRLNRFFEFQAILQCLIIFYFTSTAIRYVQVTSCETTNNSDCFDNGLGHTFCLINGTYISKVYGPSYNFNIECKSNSNNKGHIKPKMEAEQWKIENALGIYFEAYWTMHWTYTLFLIIMSLFLLMEIKEILCQIYINICLNKGSYIKGVTNGLKAHFTSLDNLIELIVIYFCFQFYVVSRYNLDFAYHSAAWMVFFGWIDLMIYTGRLDTIGRYVYMCLHIAKTMTIALFTFLPALIAFALGFFILIQTNPSFSGYYRAIFKVSVMMIGELDVDDFDHKHVEDSYGMNYSIQIMFVGNQQFINICNYIQLIEAHGLFHYIVYLKMLCLSHF